MRYVRCMHTFISRCCSASGCCSLRAPRSPPKSNSRRRRLPTVTYRPLHFGRYVSTVTIRPLCLDRYVFARATAIPRPFLCDPSLECDWRPPRAGDAHSAVTSVTYIGYTGYIGYIGRAGDAHSARRPLLPRDARHLNARPHDGADRSRAGRNLQPARAQPTARLPGR